MADLTLQQIVKTGLAPTYAAGSSGGDAAPTGKGRTFLHVKNTNAATRTVTVNSTANCDQGFDHDLSVVIPALTGDRMIGPIEPSRFGAMAAVTYDVNPPTGLTIAAVELP